MKEINQKVFNQSCETYLRHCGVEVRDGIGINCPYRAGSDSSSFIVNEYKWFDHARGEGGNVYQLALKMNGNDQARAIRSLFDAVGEPFDGSQAVQRRFTDREEAEQALIEVQQRFGISDQTPRDVVDYLSSRNITPKSYPYLAYIPEGSISQVLDQRQIELTSLQYQQGKLILWYLKNGKPAYYCTREIATKAFKKASMANGALSHPIWNIDALYRDPVIVWGEGFFDCLSLIEMGYGCAGSITCHIPTHQKDDLLKALRWRIKHHPEWQFIICLDNDELSSDGHRPGNEAAESMAIWLYSQGIDVKWVRHDPTAEKVDINKLHSAGGETVIKAMLDRAKYISELLPLDYDMVLKNFVRMLSNCDYKGASRMVTVLKSNDKDANFKDIFEQAYEGLMEWRSLYTDDIEDMFWFDSDLYVILKQGTFAENDKSYEVFGKASAALNLRRYQLNPTMRFKVENLDVLYKRPTWRVSKERNKPKDSGFNLFRPSPLLLQAKNPIAKLPEMWSRVLDNLAGPREKEWLLNHMATYVQTLHKPRTIPIFVGKQGSGKTALVSFFGLGVGGFITVGNSDVESNFNNYLQNAVILMDELASNTGEANRLKNKIKSFINETTTINNKYEAAYTIDINNYICIASNEKVTHVPVQIEKDDRRFTIIDGGTDINLKFAKWFNYGQWESELPAFMEYLLSRDIDPDAANTPLMNETKRELIGMGEDYRVVYVEEYLNEKRSEVVGCELMTVSKLCEELNELHNMKYSFTSKSTIPILKSIGYAPFMHNHQNCIKIVGVSSETASDTIASTNTEGTPQDQDGDVVTKDSSETHSNINRGSAVSNSMAELSDILSTDDREMDSTELDW